jgi:hypothetical protein
MASPDGVIVAVTVAVWPAGIESMVDLSKSTFQFVGGVALIRTFVIGAVPSFEMTICCSVAVPAVPWLLNTWSGVVNDIW